MDTQITPAIPQPPEQTWKKIMADPYFGHWYPRWINNAMENYPLIRTEFMEKDRCLTAHPRPMNRPCLIIGRGPSADKVGPLLKKWQHPTFITFTNAQFAVAHEIEPTYICAFDSVLTLERMKHHKWDKSILFTHPNIDPRTIRGWKGEKMYYRRIFPEMEFFELVLPLMFPMIRIGIRFTGSVVNNAISIAAFLGFNPIFLIGCDLAWYDHKATSAENFQFKPDGTLYVSDTQPFGGDSRMILEVNGKYTDEKMLEFKKGLLQIWASDDMNLVDCSGGILDELPKANIEDVIKNQGRGFQQLAVDRNYKAQATMRYMAWEAQFMNQKRSEGYVSPLPG